MATQAAAEVAPTVEPPPVYNGQVDVVDAAPEKSIPPNSTAPCSEQKVDEQAVVSQLESEIVTMASGSIAEAGPVSPGKFENAGIVTAGIIPESGTVGTSAETNAAVPPAAIVANGNDVPDREHSGNDVKVENVQHTVEVARGSSESQAGAKAEESEEDSFPPEVDSVQVLPHWHAKPCVHITSIGGPMKEEELLSLFTAYGQVSSISFENEKRDSAIIRYEHSSGNSDLLLVKIRGALNNTKLGDRTLIVEPYRPDSLLFIGNLTPDIDDALLHRMFEPHGRIERAFVLRNADGLSKGYGFVEYSLKGQASTAKMTMGNINMDGRVLRVEWSDCRRVADMFSTVLFVDRIPRDNPDVEQSLRNLFGQYGKVRDCHIALGIHQHFRGFAFIDFYHSICADRAHRALDGHDLEGSTIRVSYANPSKSAQSYKLRFGSTPVQSGLGFFGRGALDHTLQPLVPGMLMGASLRGSMAMPLLASRLMGPGRSGMLGMGIGMQFGRGTLDRGLISPIIGSGAGMLASGSVAGGMMGRAPLMMGNLASRPRLAIGGNIVQVGGPGFTATQGAVPITSTAIAQVATAQAKAREEEAKARAEALKQSLMKPVTVDQQSTDQYRFNASQQNFYQQQTPATTDQQYKQAGSFYSYQQPYQQTAQQQNAFQAQYQAWAQQQQSGQQTQQVQTLQYYSQPAQNYMQQQQTVQHDGYYQQSSQQSQYDGYYQQSAQQAQTTAAQQQYSQQYGQQYSQQAPYAQMYDQAGQISGQQYQQATQQQPQLAYTQQNYTEQYTQQQQAQEQGQVAAATSVTSSGTASGAGTAVGTSANTTSNVAQDPSQQQEYAAYYQQQVQAQAGTASGTAGAQSYEAQWAAYYANQAAYQQQISTTDGGQKRTADQMESASQAQGTYNYAQVASTASEYTQQVGTGSVTYQQQPAITSLTYQQQAASTLPSYQQPVTSLPYQQAVSVGTGYQQLSATATGYGQPASSIADGYQHQPAAATIAYQGAVAQGQTAVAGVYDYNKRPKY